MDGSRPTYDELLRENAALKKQVGELTVQVTELQTHLKRLTKLLEDKHRENKRQAAPFSKDQPTDAPKKPGRKKGKRHGKHHRMPPPPDDQIDEIHTATLPDACPHCGSGEIDKKPETGTQYQIELPTQPIWRKFLIEQGTCTCCGKSVHGEHELQTSQATGAAGVMLGAKAQAATVFLNKKCGLSWGRHGRLVWSCRSSVSRRVER